MGVAGGGGVDEEIERGGCGEGESWVKVRVDYLYCRLIPRQHSRPNSWVTDSGLPEPMAHSACDFVMLINRVLSSSVFQ